jgi:myosin heavy subunit
METYLLEKSRLIFQAQGERNFHVFYQMTIGMNAEEKARYFLREPEYYNYINKSGCFRVDGVDESESLLEFRVSN